MDSATLAGWLAVDLDGTLLRRDFSVGAHVATWRVVDGEREPSSWFPAAEHMLLAHLAQAFHVVPVTARDVASFGRVLLRDVPCESGAVVANGAIILRPGDMLPDQRWRATMCDELAAWMEPLGQMAVLIQERSEGLARARLIGSDTPYPAYLVGKADDGFWSSDIGLDVRERLAPFGCRIAVLGRELQVLPPPVSKRRATQVFARMHQGGRAPLLAMGDVDEDIAFMRDAVFMAAPTDSSLGRKWHAGE